MRWNICGDMEYFAALALRAFAFALPAPRPAWFIFA
jgi:hypothetical protein